MTEKSAFDTLNEIFEMVKDLQNKVNLLNQNFNILSNKINNDKPILNNVSGPLPIRASSVAEDLDKYQKKIGMGLPKENTRVFGQVFNDKKQPVFGVAVRISDTNNKLLKTIKTDAKGEWHFELKPGKYSIKYIKENMPPSYRIIDIKEGQSQLEVI